MEGDGSGTKKKVKKGSTGSEKGVGRAQEDTVVDVKALKAKIKKANKRVK